MGKKKKFLLVFLIMQLVITLILFSSASFSWLSEGVGSNANVISSSTFDIDIRVKNETNDDAVSILEASNEFEYLVKLNNKGEYVVSIDLTDASTAKNGYCKIVCNHPSSLTQYYYISVIEGGVNSGTITFKVTTLDDNVTLLFIPSLGISARNDIPTDDSALEIDFA